MTSEAIIFISDDSISKKFKSGETGTLLSVGSNGYGHFFGIIRKADGTYVAAKLDQFKKK